MASVSSKHTGAPTVSPSAVREALIKVALWICIHHGVARTSVALHTRSGMDVVRSLIAPLWDHGQPGDNISNSPMYGGLTHIVDCLYLFGQTHGGALNGYPRVGGARPQEVLKSPNEQGPPDPKPLDTTCTQRTEHRPPPRHAPMTAAP